MSNYKTLSKWQRLVKEANRDHFGLTPDNNNKTPASIFFDEFKPEVSGTADPSVIIGREVGISPITIHSIIDLSGYAESTFPNPEQVSDRIIDVITHESCVFGMQNSGVRAKGQMLANWGMAVRRCTENEFSLSEDPVAYCCSAIGCFVHQYPDLMPNNPGIYYTQLDYISAIVRILDMSEEDVRNLATQDGYGGGDPKPSHVADRINALALEVLAIEKQEQKKIDFYVELEQIIRENQEFVDVAIIDQWLLLYQNLDHDSIEFLNSMYVGLTGYDHNRIIQRDSPKNKEV